MIVDIVEDLRRVREDLIAQYGGIDGYFRHCQSQDRTRAAQVKPRRTKREPRPISQKSKY